MFLFTNFFKMVKNNLYYNYNETFDNRENQFRVYFVIVFVTYNYNYCLFNILFEHTAKSTGFIKCSIVLFCGNHDCNHHEY